MADAPSPNSIQRDEYSAADPARRRLKPKSSLLNLFRRRRRPRGTDTSSSVTQPSAESVSDSQSSPSIDSSNFISLNDSALDDHVYTDHYRWAILYENQRGLTIFSTPYYSSLSLLPFDPHSFTIPSAKPTPRSTQPKLSLTEYPLPDGAWHWVSAAWMIDMRTDGAVQHDGFEYNWRFRKNRWRADVGHVSAGGWVRRRRWVRLMVRPADVLHQHAGGSTSPKSAPRPPVIHHDDEDGQDSVLERSSREVWQGADPDEDWGRCRAVMRRAGRDGRKLELWRRWLNVSTDVEAEETGKGKARAKQWTQDEQPLPSEAAMWQRSNQSDYTLPERIYMVAVLRAHGSDILSTFIFPESRHSFLVFLARAGLLSELGGVALEPETDGGLGVEFWSYWKGEGFENVTKGH